MKSTFILPVFVISVLISTHFAIRGIQSDTARANREASEANPSFSRSIMSLIRGAYAHEGHEHKPGEGDGGEHDKTKAAACNSAREGKLGKALPGYAHGALSHFANMFFLLNVHFPSGPENALCHFANSMGMEPDLDALPFSQSKTFDDGKTVKLEIVAPTEEWAVALGYKAKGTVTVNGDVYMTLYWGGTGESSKGFMIEGSKGFDSGKRSSYAQWDRTNADAQSFKIFAAKWDEDLGISGSLAANDEDTKLIFGETSYNSTTKNMTVEVTSIERRPATSGAQKCFKMAGSGVKGDQISVAKETGSAGLALSHPSKDSTGMEGVYLLDSVSTANACQGTPTETCRPLTTDELNTLCSFAVSCEDMSTAGDTGGVFEGDAVDFDTCPAIVFEGASSC